MKSLSNRTRRTISRQAFLIAAAVLAVVTGLVTGCGSDEPPSQPNIVIILTDDQGYADVGVYGARDFATPNLDQMASEGLKFTSFYVSQAVCSASRASLLTGCYSERVGIRGALGPYSAVGLNPDEETIAELVKKRGYATGLFGKWHLGHHAQFLPLMQGFDEFFGLPYSNDMWPVGYDGKRGLPGSKSVYPELPLIDGDRKVAEIRTLADQTELTTLYTERAVAFIEKHRNRPFFLYVPHSMPHVPLGVSEKFRGKSEQGIYGDVMMEIDWSVGQILAAIERNGLTGNTLVIFVSDNGPWLNFGKHGGSAGSLREGKGTVWDGGARVPCIMRWPEMIPAGSVTDGIAATIDILPTVAAAVGAPLPEKHIDGMDLLPLLGGATDISPRDRFFYYYGGELRAVREGRYKLLFPHRSRSYDGVEPGEDGMPGPYATRECGLELYDLESDMAEKIDLARQHPEIVARLSTLAEQAREKLGDRLTGAKGNAVREPGRIGSDRQLKVEHLAVGKEITLGLAPGPKYTGDGQGALVNGIRGTADYFDGAWQGFEQGDLEAVIDLGGTVTVKEVTCGFLNNQVSWIFLPTSVEVAVSADGIDFTTVGRMETGKIEPNAESLVEEFRITFPSQPARKVRIVARNIGRCPEWHSGAGGKAWMFSDEIELR